MLPGIGYKIKYNGLLLKTAYSDEIVDEVYVK